MNSKAHSETYPINCTGDVCTGDVIRFSEAVFIGSYRKPQYAGDRTITANVVKDSYGSQKQQHTFTLEVISVSGEQADDIEIGKKIRRKGRNVYRNDCWRKLWKDESLRQQALDEKHHRGSRARALRQQRIMTDAIL
ncbi:MAG: hypothetical protein OEZ58_00105 [Gammaproteobacteria bacterium]|nr:hypothetical protein [Gammaproteobacteria bacterium]